MTVTNTAARNRKVSVLAALGTMLALLSSPPVHAEFDSFRPFLPLQVSTAPANGDLNPYGLVFVPAVFPSGGVLKPGQMLVSNFNDTSLQGRGSTIITIDPNNGQTGLFFQGTPPIGFTNALGVVHAGLVFAGSVFHPGRHLEHGGVRRAVRTGRERACRDDVRCVQADQWPLGPGHQ